MTSKPATRLDVAPQSNRRRPTVAVVIVSVFLFAQAALYLFLGIALLVSSRLFAEGPTPALLERGSLTLAGLHLVSAAFILVFGVLALAILIGFLFRQRWAWVAAITWVTISLAVGLVSYFRGAPSYSSMIINVILVIALNQTAVQKEFQNDRAGWR